MDWLARIFDWLREQEAGFSAMAAIAVLAGILFTGVRFLLRRRPQPTPEATTQKAPEEDPLLALPTGPVVAVLPFENLSEDPKQDYFSDGLTEGIITALSRFRDLFVIARNSTFRYKGQAVDVRQLNKELGARYVLEGSVQRSESTLRVTAQLLDARDGTHLWAETYDRELSASNLFAVQDEITEQVVGTVASSSGVISRSRFAQVKEKPTETLDAHESVLRASAYYRSDPDPSEHATVRDALERAVQKDPSCSGAWAWLAVLFTQEHTLNFNPRPDPLDRALEAAKRAVALDASNHAGHWALAQAYFFRHELESFFAETERALSLTPNDPGVLSLLGLLLHYAGDERGITFVKKAMKLDPLHPPWYHYPIAALHFERGEYEEALVAARKLDVSLDYNIPLLLAAIYAELGHQDEAASALDELLRIWPGFTTETLVEEWRKWNISEENTRLYVSALRKAGLPEGTEA